MIQQLANEEEVDALMSAPGPIWLLKHSNSCSISSAALDEVSRFLGDHPEQQAGVVVIQSHRPLSNHVSQRLKFVHQSPQLFLLKEGKVVWSATHWSITADAMSVAAASASA
ncbi:MAG: bacillithiol system redox-active protein YtxJ [Planctomycetes bacterium]|jgi:bacillithiol system protein YtxJ|nr:bacillithiol system redox-active protein YtxJ [Planctomycetota bacterium]